MSLKNADVFSGVDALNATLNKNASNQSGGTIDKNASNQSGGTLDSTALGCGVNSMYPYTPNYTSYSKKTVRTTTTVREFNDQGNLVKETETIVEEETNPVYTSSPSIYSGVGTFVQDSSQQVLHN